MVTEVTATPATVNVGETTRLALTASDPDGDPLAYAWTSDCAGAFSDAKAVGPTFSPHQRPLGDLCTLAVAVTDGHGGTASGEVTISVGRSTNAAPVIDSTYLSDDFFSSGSPVVLRVTASDPDGDALSFSWTVDGIGVTSSDTSTTSELSWAPPACADASVDISVRVSDGVSAATWSSLLPPAPSYPSCAGGVSSIPQRSVWVTNGSVSAAAEHDGTLYFGGNFTYVGPQTGNFVAVDAATGARDASWPTVHRYVTAATSDGAGGWYIGGSLDAGRSATSWIARIRANGTIDPTFNPVVEGYLRDLAVIEDRLFFVARNHLWIGGSMRTLIGALDITTGRSIWSAEANGPIDVLTESAGTVFVGGFFSDVSGAMRSNLAALDAGTGRVTSWNPGTNFEVTSLEADAGTIYIGTSRSIAAVDARTAEVRWDARTDGHVKALALDAGTIYVGGGFSTVAGEGGGNLAALDAATGEPRGWRSWTYGAIRALAVAGDTIYVGGDFSEVDGGPRSRIAALDSTTGEAKSWNPGANGSVWTLAVSGSTVFAGGAFSSLGGESRANLAAIDTLTGELTRWSPEADNSVSALAVGGGAVYAGGMFTNIGGTTRRYLAALDPITGQATSWNPGANGRVSTIAVGGGTVYIAGSFTRIGASHREDLAAVDAATGKATGWNPGGLVSTVRAIAISGSTVYVGGEFNSIGGQSRGGVAALDAMTGAATSWNPAADGLVSALVVNGDTVYVGGVFSSVGGQRRSNLAALDVTTGEATSWDPGADGTIYALAVSGGTVYAGGSFGQIGGQDRKNLAAIDASAGKATSWNPDATAPVHALAVSGGAVFAGGTFVTIGSRLLPGLAGFAP